MLSSTDCESGTSAAPNVPCSTGNNTICTRDCAIPHSMDAAVKPAMQTKKSRLSPNRPARKPVGGVMIDGGDDVGGQHPVDLVLGRRDAALHIRQRDVGDGDV